MEGRRAGNQNGDAQSGVHQSLHKNPGIGQMLGLVKKDGPDEGVALPEERSKLDGNAEGRAQKRVLQIEVKDMGGAGLEKAPGKGGFPGLTGADNEQGAIILEIDRFGPAHNIGFRKKATNQRVGLVRLRQPGIILQYPVFNFAAHHESHLTRLIMIVNHN